MERGGIWKGSLKQLPLIGERGAESFVPARPECGAYRDRMRDEVVRFHRLLITTRRITLADAAAELGVCERTARRWADSFGLIMPVRVESGVILVGEGEAIQ
jgi:hypothetical protein